MSDSVNKKSKFLGLFWDLASEENPKRLEAAGTIIEHLQSLEAASIRAGSSNRPSDLDYALKRLVRGLGSSREAARQGFATCLCELLKVSSITISETLILLDEHTKIIGSMKGSEERDMMFGKLFGYIAIIRSGKLKVQPSMTKSSSMENNDHFLNTVDTEMAVNIFDRILELHAMKGWIREVTSEAMLSLLESLDFAIFDHISAKLDAILSDTMGSDVSPWQLTLSMGLELYQGIFPLFANSIGQIILEGYSFSGKNMPALTPILMTSTAGFPKIHRVWDYILGSIFGMTRDRMLPLERLAYITTAQAELLEVLARFMDRHLITFSHEKRGVAMHLVIDLVRLCPVDLLPIALTKTMVRSLLAARVNKKNTLHVLAGQTINSILKIALREDSKCKLALASAFVAHGGANFDSLTGINVVGSLLEGLNEESIEAHIEFICKNIKIRPSEPNKAEIEDGGAQSKQAENDNDKDEADNEIEEDQAKSIFSTIEALAALAKNLRIPHRGYICCVAVSVLVRLACFQANQLHKTKRFSSNKPEESKKSKKAKKSKNQDVEEDNMTLLIQTIPRSLMEKSVDCIRKVEKGLSNLDGDEDTERDSSIKADKKNAGNIQSIRTRIAEMASTKLLTLLADMSSTSLMSLNGTGNAPNVESASDGIPVVDGSKTSSSQGATVNQSPSLLDVCMSILFHLKVTSNLKLAKSYIDNDGEEDEEESGSDEKQELQIVQSCCEAFQLLSCQGSELSMPVNLKVSGAFASLLAHSLFQAMTSKEIQFNVVSDILSVCRDLVLPFDSKSKGETSNDDEDDSSSEIDPLILLLDASLELLSMPADHSIKGIRDAIKKTWTVVVQHNIVSAASGEGRGGPDKLSGSSSKTSAVSLHDEPFVYAGIVDAVIEAVIGDDIDDDEGEHDNDHGDEEDIDEDDSDNDSDKQLEHIKKKTEKVSFDQAKPSQSGSDHDDDEEDDDVVIDEDEMLDMLGEGGSDDDDSDGLRNMVLEHSEEADGALVEMLKLKKQHRKEGILAAKRREYLIRTRALDIFEVLLNRCESGIVLYSLLQPLFVCFKKTLGSSMAQSLQEGRAFEQRLKHVLEHRICKKKLHFRIFGLDGEEETPDDEAVDSISIAELTPMFELLSKGLNSTMQDLRHISHVMWILLIKPVLHTTQSTTNPSNNLAVKLLADFLTKLFSVYANKKSNRIPTKFFDDIVVRFPDIAVESMLEAMIEASMHGKSPFLRTDCCRLINELLKRWKSMHSSSQSRLVGMIPRIISNIATMINAASTRTAENGNLSTKRLKSVLTLGKDVVHFLKANSSSALADVISKDLIDALQGCTKALQNSFSKESSSTPSNAVAQLVKQMTTTIDAILPSFLAQQKSATLPPSATKVSNKKRPISTDSKTSNIKESAPDATEVAAGKSKISKHKYGENIRSGFDNVEAKFSKMVELKMQSNEGEVLDTASSKPAHSKKKKWHE